MKRFLSCVFSLLVIGGAGVQTTTGTETVPAYVPKQSDRPAPMEGDEPGFEAIFDGKSLTGWAGDLTYWRVEAGTMIGEITEQTRLKSNTFILWQGGRPKDFELRLEFRITESGNSGINYRSSVVPDKVTPTNAFAMRGYQFDLDGKNRYTGSNYEEKGRLFLGVRGSVSRVVGTRPPIVIGRIGEDAELAKVITPGWNSVHLIARGNTLTHMLNGQVMCVVIDDDTAGPAQDGQIGMQVHTGPPMKVEYRNIRLKTF
ncbi:glycosyl hydrolase [Nibricoccus aquaticus]|uniref:Glycosyl hydrolase n=1 Tax=Nibricoccus aquaticus TaxID=2576891 RepID=A0A290Q8Q9_9BACT|nr:DUF1080 domain-containing protein [Nibricoccus aquaticus]ATC62616.1 glycosyl hydrolase [Nibricoccus aquaticus]